MRLAALYGPDALAFSPRAPRKTADVEVRVVVGLQALTRAVAEVERVADEAKSSGARHSYDEDHANGQSDGQPRFGRAPRPWIAMARGRSKRKRAAG